MTFSYLHVAWFPSWIVLGAEEFPYGFLTMLVSLEAIVLSTFVMISQNRADAKLESLAEHLWQLVQAEEQNEDLLTIAREIPDLTEENHRMGGGKPSSSSAR